MSSTLTTPVVDSPSRISRLSELVDSAPADQQVPSITGAALREPHYRIGFHPCIEEHMDMIMAVNQISQLTTQLNIAKLEPFIPCMTIISRLELVNPSVVFGNLGTWAGNQKPFQLKVDAVKAKRDSQYNLAVCFNEMPRQVRELQKTLLEELELKGKAKGTLRIPLIFHPQPLEDTVVTKIMHATKNNMPMHQPFHGWEKRVLTFDALSVAAVDEDGRTRVIRTYPMRLN